MNYKESYQECLSWAEEHDKGLHAGDFCGAAFVAHRDGSTFFINNAFLVIKDKFVVLFSEHHRYFVFDLGDTIKFANYTIEEIKRL